MSGTAILCSGQGLQSADMFDLFADAPEAAPVFAAATVVLDGRDARLLVREASDDELHANRLGQILCCTQALAAWAVVGMKVPGPLVVAGYSAGELAAWGVAGLINHEEVLSLAAQRAAAMDAVTTRRSGLVAIRGLTRDSLETICRAHGAFVAIVNSATQMLVGGTIEMLDAVVDDARAHGATRTTMVPVEVAAHTPLLNDASDAFRQSLARAHLTSEVPSGVRLLSGIDGTTVLDVQTGADKLARQTCQMVNWAACMESCHAAEVTKVVELGPGNALARMMRDITSDADAHSVSEFHSLAGLEEWIARGPG